MKDDNLKELLNKDFEVIFNDMDLFIFNIPVLAKVIGVGSFLTKMGFTQRQYYLRTNFPEKWTVQELKNAKDIFLETGFGKSLN